MKRTTDAPSSQEKKQKVFMEGPTTCGVVLNQEQKAQEEKTRKMIESIATCFPIPTSTGNFSPEAVRQFQEEVQAREEKMQKKIPDFSADLASHIETCTGKYFGNVPLPMVAELVRKGVEGALKISEGDLGEIIGEIDQARNANRPFYAVAEIQKKIGDVECSDKFVFSSLERYRDAGNCIANHKGKLTTVFYGPGNKAKFLSDTTPEQRARVDDEAFFFETMTEKYGAEFSMLGSGGFGETIEKLNAMCDKKESELSKKDLFILNHLARTLNKAEDE